MDILKKPLSLKSLKKRLVNNRISVNVKISFLGMIDCYGFDSFNEMIDDLIILEEGYLSDINYKIVGSIPATKTDSGYVIINVVAELNY